MDQQPPPPHPTPPPGPQTDWGYGVVVSVMRRGTGGSVTAVTEGASGADDLEAYVVDALLVCNSASLAAGVPVPGKLGGWATRGAPSGLVAL